MDHAVLALGALCLACWPASANASPLLELLGGNFDSGGFNARGTGASAASAYFNPALLPHAEEGLEVGFLLLNDAISVELDGRNTEADLQRARSFNIALNQLMEEKARIWNERQDRVDIVFRP